MKVAIIGAGICGLYLAWKLSEKGYQVTIFEKKAKIGKEVCSGLFSERILEFIPQSQKLIQNKINYCLIHFPRKTLKIKFSSKFLVMSHFELDNLVSDLAKKAGVKIILNSKVTRNVLVNLEKKFDKIIGSDGANSIIRESLNLPSPLFRLAIQGFVESKGGQAKEDFMETWTTRNGFIWKIPRGREVEWGIIERPKLAREIFEEFLKRSNLKIERINSAIVPESLIIPSNPKITLCGDASGLTKPWSGGGVVWSLIAANILLKNFPDFLKYKREVKKFFLPKIIFGKLAKRIVYFFGFKIPWLLPKNYKVESDFLI